MSKAHPIVVKFTIVCFILFVLGSTGDVVTTYIGLSNGFAEQTAFVDWLWGHMGILGLIISKIIAVLALGLLSLPFYLFNKNMGLLFYSVVCIFGFLLYGFATVHNLNLLFF